MKVKSADTMTRGFFRKTCLRLSPPLRLPIFSLIFTGLILSSICALNAQTPEEESRPLKAEYFTEAGCPVKLESARAVLDLDPFDAPRSSKIYITYKNISNQSLMAVKFRIRFVDPEKRDRGTFHAPDGHPMAPEETRTQQWKKESGLHPGITVCQIRALQVRFSDGSVWESVRMKNLGASPAEEQNESGGQEGGSSGEGSPTQGQEGAEQSRE